MEYTEKELEQERWKPIFGYDGMYEVSDLGRVRSRKRCEWKVMSAKKSRSGYLVINLSKYGKQKTVKIHRLVAQAFIPNDNIFNTEVNHIDECKQNNRVSNIEWCDRRYNNTYNEIHHRRTKYKRDKIKSLYNPNLSIQKNLEIFKANGVECSRDTVKHLRKDLGLTKKTTK